MKRGYSRAFPLQPNKRRYLLDHIPAGLWLRVRQKAKRDGLSVRTLLLQLLTRWLDEPDAPSGR
jgi:hypothetical protein